jgi:hypothetical protein
MPEGAPAPVVWIVNRQHWPRACLRAELLERGFEAIGFTGPAPALAALVHGLYPAPAVIVIELHRLRADAAELKALERTGVACVALAGAVEADCKPIRQLTWRVFLQRPFTIGKVADQVAALLNEKPAPNNPVWDSSTPLRPV